MQSEGKMVEKVDVRVPPPKACRALPEKSTDLVTCAGGLPGRSLLDLHIKIFQSHTKNKKKKWKKMRIVVKGRPCKYREEEGGKKKKVCKIITHKSNLLSSSTLFPFKFYINLY